MLSDEENEAINILVTKYIRKNAEQYLKNIKGIIKEGIYANDGETKIEDTRSILFFIEREINDWKRKDDDSINFTRNLTEE